MRHQLNPGFVVALVLSCAFPIFARHNLRTPSAPLLCSFCLTGIGAQGVKPKEGVHKEQHEKGEVKPTDTLSLKMLSWNKDDELSDIYEIRQLSYDEAHRKVQCSCSRVVDVNASEPAAYKAKTEGMAKGTLRNAPDACWTLKLLKPMTSPETRRTVNFTESC